MLGSVPYNNSTIIRPAYLTIVMHWSCGVAHLSTGKIHGPWCTNSLDDLKERMKTAHSFCGSRFERMDVLAEPQRLTSRVSELLQEARTRSTTARPGPGPVSPSRTNEPVASGASQLSFQHAVEAEREGASSSANPVASEPLLERESVASVLADGEDKYWPGTNQGGQLKVFLDIGGNRELQAVTAVLPALQRLEVCHP